MEPSRREKLATLRCARSVGGTIVPVATKLRNLMRPLTSVSYVTCGMSSSEQCKYVESFSLLSNL